MIAHFGVPQEEIAKYVGITFASFSFCQFFTGIWWGRASDKFGRKPMVMLGLSGTLLSLMVFGFSTNIKMAIAARCFSGLVNGNVWNQNSEKDQDLYSNDSKRIVGGYCTDYDCRNGS
jgi:MFS family permease